MMTGRAGQLPDIDENIIASIDRLLPGLARILRQAISHTEHPGALNAQLARLLHVAAPSMTAMIDGLVERGLVDRSIDPNNRRQVLILLTEVGAIRLAEMEEMMHARLQLVISHLDHEERQQALKGITLLQDAMLLYHRQARESG